MRKSNYEKIIKLFQEEELGSKILAFDEMRDILSKAIENKQAQLDEELEKFNEIKQSIKKQ